MRECPKCSRNFDDESKICRTCGTILEDAPEEAVDEPVEDVAEEPPFLPGARVDELPAIDVGDSAESEESASPGSRKWVCPRCAANVSPRLEACWKCGGNKLGQILVDEFEKLPEANSAAKAKKGKTRCAACGSRRIVSNVAMIAMSGTRHGRLYVSAVGDPGAFIFSNEILKDVAADVCGDCGHLQLRVCDPGGFYHQALRSRR